MGLSPFRLVSLHSALQKTNVLTTFSVLTGVFLFAGTTAKSSNAFLGWNAGYTFTSNVMYGVLYAVSPELFPTKDRGTGNTLVALSNRIFGIAVSEPKSLTTLSLSDLIYLV